MKIHVESSLWQQIRTHAESGYPLEVCGFLLGSLDLEKREIHIQGGRPATNERIDAAQRRYRIEPAEYRTAEQEATDAGTQIVGIYHSHPDAPAEPSTFDLTHAWPNQVYVIVSVNHGAASELTGWILAHDRHSFDRVEIPHDASRPLARVEGAKCLRF